MKLLPKSEIVKQKATVQKQTIDEGKKLAIRIDTLRETVADEEASLEKFRSETLQQIHKETSEAIVKRDNATGEVKELEARRAEAIKPLTAEQEAIDRAIAELELKRAEIGTQERTLDAREQTIREQEKQTDLIVIKLESDIHLATEARKEAEANRDETEIAKTTMLVALTEAEDLRTILNTELVHREKVCSDNENSVTLREEKLKSDQAELLKGWRLLEDRKAMHERNLNRIKQ